MILVTGGTGYIGSHAVVALQAAGYDVVILDNLSNSRADVVERIAAISGTEPRFIEGDICDHALLGNLFKKHKIQAVMHFAGLKSVSESVSNPLSYYEQNVGGTVTLLNAMRMANVRTMIFSSSATVYGDASTMPVAETCPLAPTNPYGQTKAMIETILTDMQKSEPDWRIANLRYFNPVGAHESGLIGEAPVGVPNNLMPYIAQVASGQRDALTVFGKDYPTADGTGVRDFIHVADLAEGHVATLRHLENKGGCLTLNLGTGTGYSVLDAIKAFEKASGRPVAHRFAPRRAGDVAESWADPALAAKTIGWRATRDLDTMCTDMWRWQQNGPFSPIKSGAKRGMHAPRK